MHFQIRLLVVIISWSLLSCTNDDEPQMNLDNEGSSIDYKLIGEDDENVYLYSFEASTNQGITTNLTQEDNVSRRYITLRQVEDVITFFSISQGRFSVVQKNVNTGAQREVQDFYTIFSEQSIIWGAVSETQIFMAYYSPPGSDTLGVRTIDIESGAFIDTALATSVFDTTEPYYLNGQLFMAYQNNTNEYNMIILNTDDLSILRNFEFGQRVPSFLVDNAGALIIITGDSSSDFELGIYDFESLELLESSSFNLAQFLFPGPLEANAIDGKLYYANILAQPSPIPFAPAVLEFSSSENTIIEMSTILDDVRQEIQDQITFTAYGFIPAERIFLLGYAESGNGMEFQGGVLVISENGTLLDITELPFVPTYFVKP